VQGLRVRAAVLTVALGVAVPPLAAGVAHADGGTTVATAVVASNWFYDDPGAAAGGVTPVMTPTSVPAGSLGVGYRAVPAGAPAQAGTSEADKETFLEFNLAAVQKGARFTTFTVTVPVDMTDSSSALQVMTVPPALAACRSAGAFTPGKGPSPYSSAPALDCSQEVPGAFDAGTGRYSFPVPAIAQQWLDDTNTGLAIVPDPKAPPPASFTLSLQPADKVTVSAIALPASSGAAPAGTQQGTAPVAGGAPAAANPSAPRRLPTPTASARATAPPTRAAAASQGASPAAPVPAPAPPPAGVDAPAVAAVPLAAAVIPNVAPTESAAADAAAPVPVTQGAPVQAAPALLPAGDMAVVVKGPFGPLAWVLLLVVGLVAVALLSLSLSAPPEGAAASGPSRLSRLLSARESASHP